MAPQRRARRRLESVTTTSAPVVAGPVEHLGVVLVEEAGAVEDRPVGVDHPGRRGRHQPVAVAGHDHRVLGGQGPHDRGGRPRPGTRPPAAGPRGPGRVASSISSSSGSWAPGLVLDGLAERDRLAQPGDRAHQRPRGLRARGAEALVLEVGAQDDVAGADQPGQRGQRVGVEGALLQRPVDGVEQVGRHRASRRGISSPGHVRAVHEPGGDRVDRVAPAVGGEVGAGQLEHPGVVGSAVEVGGGVRPSTSGSSSSRREVAVDHLAHPDGRQVGDDEDRRPAPPTGRPGGGGAGRGRPTPAPSSTDGAEHEQRQRPGAWCGRRGRRRSWSTRPAGRPTGDGSS